MTGYRLITTLPPFILRTSVVLLVLTVHTMNYVVADGRSNWMEGLILICMFLSFFLHWLCVPSSSDG